MQGFSTQVRTQQITNGLSLEVTMTVMSVVEESRIRNLAKFTSTITYIYITTAATLHDWHNMDVAI